MRILASKIWYAGSESRNESQPHRLAQHERSATLRDYLRKQALESPTEIASSCLVISVK